MISAETTQDWVALKSSIVESIGISRDAAHIGLSLVLLLIFALLLRKSVASPWPLLCVLVLELINEALDFGRFGSWNEIPERLRPELIRDVVVTMFAPVLLFLVARIAPGLLVTQNTNSSDDADASEGAEIEN